MKPKNLFAIMMFMLLAFTSHAQEANVEMADAMRSSGKIYVVIGVIAIIFICVLLLLISIERKLSRLENELKQTKK